MQVETRESGYPPAVTGGRVRDKTALVDWASAYVVVSLVVLLVASLVTGWTQARMQSVPPGDGIRVIAVTASFALVLEALVGAKVMWSRRSATDSVDRES